MLIAAQLRYLEDYHLMHAECAADASDRSVHVLWALACRAARTGQIASILGSQLGWPAATDPDPMS